MLNSGRHAPLSFPGNRPSADSSKSAVAETCPEVFYQSPLDSSFVVTRHCMSEKKCFAESNSGRHARPNFPSSRYGHRPSADSGKSAVVETCPGVFYQSPLVSSLSATRPWMSVENLFHGRMCRNFDLDARKDSGFGTQGEASDNEEKNDVDGIEVEAEICDNIVKEISKQNCDKDKIVINNDCEASQIKNCAGDISDKNSKLNVQVSPNVRVTFREQFRNFEQENEDRILSRHQMRNLRRWYYLEGGWGWNVLIVAIIVNIINHGIILSFGHIIAPATTRKFDESWPTGHSLQDTGLVWSVSNSVPMLLSPVTVSFCRRRSTRLTAVLGGLIATLGCLFTSFASQFHQLFFSFGAVLGIGLSMTKETSNLMIGQYFKKRRHVVEVFIVSASGLGISLMSFIINAAIGALEWRYGLQAITAAVFITFPLGMFYRSASLYHPQRRAILHLKNQKRRMIKDRKKIKEENVPFFDFACLRSKTIQILMVSTGVSSFGINTPIFFLSSQAREEGLGEGSVLLLQVYLGLAWALGCCLFGGIVVHRSGDCVGSLAGVYLCQISVFICGISILMFASVQGYSGYVVFVWIYGVFFGGYNYSLKMFVYGKARARNFAKAWGFVQCSQAIPNGLGIPIAGYINVGFGNKAGCYFSATCVLLGSITLGLIHIHKRTGKKCDGQTFKEGKSNPRSDSVDTVVGEERRNSLPGDDFLASKPFATPRTSFNYGNLQDFKNYLWNSEEGIADMDLPDHILQGIDCLDNITSCNKVENNLMLSEYEQNLMKETEGTEGEYKSTSVKESDKAYKSSRMERRRQRWPFHLTHSSPIKKEPSCQFVGKNTSYLKNKPPRRGGSVYVPNCQSSSWKILSPNTKRNITTIHEV